MKRIFQSIASFACCSCTIVYMIMVCMEHWGLAFAFYLGSAASNAFLLKYPNDNQKEYDLMVSRILDFALFIPFAESFALFPFAILLMVLCIICWTDFIYVVPNNNTMNGVHKILYWASILLIFVYIYNPTNVLSVIVSASAWVCVLFDLYMIADASKQVKAMKNQE